MREVNVYGFDRSSSRGNIVQFSPYLITTVSGSASWYSPYYEVTSGSSWYYDYEFSKTAGNQFYIGIERFDANKTPTSNAGCVYQTTDKNNNLTHKRIQGAVDLSKDSSGSVCKYIRFRVLSNWTGTTTSGSAEIYRISLREVAPGETSIKQVNTFNKKGVVSSLVLETGSEVRPEKFGTLSVRDIVEY